ncbi:HlyD family efflux transporter periplasmic adaptor subunit [Oribacterium sp. WCC10]|uniref:HlyD family efflux transporter periplasmic adaptor subunit n=1 Tax=Oribacterium sp. WCC10 TaxID=1855343 RepID=UPI0008E895E9|nr:HlyD family efflux transporter periplasmic adaptor subunit [Oribacterium sp. WCC10]SFG53160.1 HlyD family secretion protein [Oribacterium sp. WCC10]
MIKYIKRGIICLLCIGIIAGAVWYFMQPESMIVIVAERKSINPVIYGTGKISGGRKITIYADVTGLVESKEVQVGDRVKAGDKLVQYVKDDQKLQVDLARTDAEYSKKILNADINQKAKYESMMNAATLQINNCAQTYTTLEEQLRAMTNESYGDDRFIADVKKQYDSDILKLQDQMFQKQQGVAQTEVELKKIELLTGDEEEASKEKVDKKTDKAIDYYESISELNRKITDIEVDKLTLPEEGMEPEKHEKYLELQANMETVLKLWSEARAQKEFAQSMLVTNGDIYNREQQLALSNRTLENAEKELNKAETGTNSTTDGIVTACFIDKGASVEKGAPIMEIETDDEYLIKMKVSKYDIHSIGLGQKAEVRIGDKKYTGEVIRIGQSAENDSSGKAKAVAEIKLDTRDELIVGLDADVTLELEEVTDTIGIPNECIYNDDDGSYLYMIRDGVVTKVYVITGAKDNTMTEVEGIKEGDHVIMDPAASEYVGEEVEEIVYTGQ